MTTTAHRDTFTIGRLARECGVSIDTIRYYERERLLAPPGRTAAGYRLYGADAVTRLRFIRQAKALGFMLEEIGELLALKRSPASTCSDVRARTQAKIADLEGRIAALDRMRATLERLAVGCPGDAPVGDCPILGALEAAPVQAASPGTQKKNALSR
jgi:MerR family copper efflux transcriptional regulator